MKTITINVSEPIYNDFQAYANKADRSTSEIIREAMAAYHRSFIRPQGSIADIPAATMGRLQKPIDLSNLADEMLP